MRRFAAYPCGALASSGSGGESTLPFSTGNAAFSSGSLLPPSLKRNKTPRGYREHPFHSRPLLPTDPPRGSRPLVGATRDGESGKLSGHRLLIS